MILPARKHCDNISQSIVNRFVREFKSFFHAFNINTVSVPIGKAPASSKTAGDGRPNLLPVIPVATNTFMIYLNAYAFYISRFCPMIFYLKNFTRLLTNQFSSALIITSSVLSACLPKRFMPLTVSTKVLMFLSLLSPSTSSS